MKRLTREQLYFISFCILIIPTAILPRFLGLSNIFFDAQPLRQAQTAMTAFYMSRGESGFFNYSSPLGGYLWNFVREFPIYQWVLSLFLRTGFDIIVTSRLLTLFSFFASVPFLYTFVRRVTNPVAARWSTAFYLGMPFTVLYSRVCQVDMVSLAALVIGAHYAAAYLEKATTLRWALATFFLALSGLIKLTIWFAPAAFFGCYVLSRSLRSEGVRKSLPIFFSLSIQVGLVGAWAAWAEHIFYSTGNLPGQGWLLGGLADRINPAKYLRLFNSFYRDVLSFWLLVPLLLGVFYLRKKAFILALLFASAFGAIFLFFNVSLYHNYYFLASLLPVLVVCGLGMVQLFDLSTVPRTVVLLLLVGLFLNYARGLSATYENFLSLRVSQVDGFEKFKSLTDPEDVILPDEYNDAVLPAFHAQRLFSQIREVDLSRIHPSVLYFQSEQSLALPYVHQQPIVSIEGEIGGLYVYRMRDVGKKKFSSEKHLAVLRDVNEAVDHVLIPEAELKVDICKVQRGHTLIKNTAPSTHILDISFNRTKTTFKLPSGNFLSLPRHSSWGCVATIKSRPPKTEAASLLAQSLF